MIHEVFKSILCGLFFGIIGVVLISLIFFSFGFYAAFYSLGQDFYRTTLINKEKIIDANMDKLINCSFIEKSKKP